MGELLPSPDNVPNMAAFPLENFRGNILASIVHRMAQNGGETYIYKLAEMQQNRVNILINLTQFEQPQYLVFKTLC